MKKGIIQSRHARNRAIRIALLALVVVVVAVALGWFVSGMFNKVSDQAEQSTNANLETQASELASRLALHFEEVEKAVADILHDPALADLIAFQDTAAIRDREIDLVASLPGAISIRLLAPGMNTTDSANKPPIGYASLDAIRRAERQEGPLPAELHKFGSDDAHLLFVRRILDVDEVMTGVFWMAYDASILSKLLAAEEPQDTYIALRQIGGGNKTLFDAGTKPAASVRPTVRKNITGSTLQIAIWDSSAATSLTNEQGETGLPLGLIVGLVAVVIVLGGVGMVIMRRRGKKEADAPSFGGAITEIQAGHHPGAEAFVPGVVSDGDVVTQPKAGTVEAPPEPLPADPAPVAESVKVPESIFRAYDIRGIVGKTLSAEIVREIGRAIGTEAFERGQQGIIVARDGRISGPELMEALIQGLRDTGQDVIDIGMVPTPVLYFATHYMETGSGVMLTGSHNPPDYNGLKITLGGDSLYGDAIKGLYQRIAGGELRSGNGNLQTADIGAEYIRRISEDIPVALGNSLKIVVDCGNGVAGAMAPQLITALGHDVVELFCEVDGNFPNHHPDPSQPENLVDMINAVKENSADLGLAFDGDGDRVGVVDNEGNVIWPDSLMILYARDVLSRNPGAEILFDVKCSTHLAAAIEEAGGKAVMWKTGHSFIKSRMKETGSLLAGEMSGHIFFKERWYGFDDAIYAAARLLEILMAAGKPASEVFGELPVSVNTPELRIDMVETEHASFMQALSDSNAFGDAKIITIDGLRAEYPNGWGLIRGSNTTPCLIMRFEADSEAAMQEIQEQFRAAITAVKADISLPF